MTREEFESLFLPPLLSLLSISEEEFNQYKNQLYSGIEELSSNGINDLTYTTQEYTPNFWTNIEFQVAKASYSDIFTLLSTHADLSIILQSINAYEEFINQTELLSGPEKDHLLMNLAFAKIVISGNVTFGGSGDGGWGCAGDVVIPMLAGAATGDGGGAVAGLAAGLWTAYRNGCMN